MNHPKITVYIPMESWKRGEGAGWGDGKEGCANTFIQKSHGVMSHFGDANSRLDRVVTEEVIWINDNKATPDSYKIGALKALLEPYNIELVFVAAQPCEIAELASVRKSADQDDDLTTV